MSNAPGTEHAAAAAAHAFITRWSGVTASELATAQSFVIDLCALLGACRSRSKPAWVSSQIRHQPPSILRKQLLK